MIARLQPWVEVAAGFFYPENCQLCGCERATAREGYVCSRCWQEVRFVVPPICERCGLPFQGMITTRFDCTNCREIELHFESARAAVVAKGVVLEVIHRFKYGRALWFENFLGDLLCRAAATELRQSAWEWIVPVPLHPLKQREREFNQAERLARRLGSATGIPVNNRIIKRQDFTRTQTLLTRKERAMNVRDAFAIRDGVRLDGDRIVLVDDVLTTGATTSACAERLLRAGAGRVVVWTVARGV